MFGFLNRKKKDKPEDDEFMKALNETYLEGVERAIIDRALETLSVELDHIDNRTEYCFKRSSEIVTEIVKSCGTDIKLDDDDILTAGLFLFVVSNHISYKLDTSFEQVSSMAVAAFLKNNKTIEEIPDYINAIAGIYNKTAVDSKVTIAIGQNLIKWLESPSDEHFSKLLEIYGICRTNME